MARPFDIAETVGENNTKVTSPYNFVEPAPKVGITPWVEEEGFDAPSHDVPLPNGLCGELTVDWTFERQFLIGGTEKVNKVTKQAILRNSARQDEMILPGASLRGMSRNVLEIIIGARMIHVDREARFSFRDNQNKKQNHRYNVGDKLPSIDDVESNRLDFVQALFGHVPPDDVALNPADHQTQAWKSRVFFGHASLKQEDKTGADLKRFKINAVTQSPRASFGAYYLRPKPGENPREIGWSDPNVQMAGYKRYPVSRSLRPFSENQGNQANSVGSAMEFVTGIGGNENMPVEVTFTSKIKLHNLHPLELGGLLWMLGWGQAASADANNQYRHQLGRGKPQGYGVVRAEVDYENSRIVSNRDGKPCSNNSDFCNALIEQFESWLSHTFDEDNGRKVRNLPHVASLMAMANPDIGDKINEHLRYPTSAGSQNALIDGHKAVKQASKNTTSYLWRYPEE